MARCAALLSTGAFLLASALPLAIARPALGQIFPGMSSRVDLAETVQVAEADAESKLHLERAQQFVANGQWEEALDSWTTVLAAASGKLAPLTKRRYVSLRDYCHVQIARLPPEGLAMYRGRVDPQARTLYDRGVADRDESPLREIVRDLFCSSWGDQALSALAEMALERGDYAAARGYWERLLPLPPVPPPAEGTADESAPGMLIYPDSDLDPAAIKARLVLSSILEGNADAVRRGLEVFRSEMPSATGKLGGKQGKYVELLGALASDAERWPRPAASSNDWLSFAGSVQRDRAAAPAIEPTRVRWRAQLQMADKPDRGQPFRRVAERTGEPLSCHPLVLGNVVFVNDLAEIRALDIATGGPAWGTEDAIFVGEGANEVRRPGNRIGVERFTMTAHGGRLFARMGSPITGSQQLEPMGRQEPGYLVCLDIERQGALVWKSAKLAAGWAFEGSPVCDGANVYVAMRRSDVRPLAHVACLDAETGKERWRTFVCGADTPAQGLLDEVTHNLLTLHGETLFVNTNLGAVAALDARDGEVRWLTLYPRALSADLDKRAAHFFRDLNPCVYWRGLVFAAPADSRHIVAFDAASGTVAWQNHLPEDATHLLGVGGDNLIASGDRLWWLRAETGKAIADPWPDGGTPDGIGRGTLAGDAVLFPTQDRIFVFDQETAQMRAEIDLKLFNITGGNLVSTGDVLLVAGFKDLWALDSRIAASAPAGAAPNPRTTP